MVDTVNQGLLIRKNQILIKQFVLVSIQLRSLMKQKDQYLKKKILEAMVTVKKMLSQWHANQVKRNVSISRMTS